MCNNIFGMTENPEIERGQAAFLLSQLGSHAAAQFAERLKPLELSPADAGILRLLRHSGGISQQELSVRLGIHASRLVAILDNLEKRSLVERKPNAEDRRLYSLYLTQAGGDALIRVGSVARAHQEALLSALSSEERLTLSELLQRVADQQGLARGIHPGYRRVGKEPKDS